MLQSLNETDAKLTLYLSPQDMKNPMLACFC